MDQAHLKHIRISVHQILFHCENHTEEESTHSL